MRFKQKLIGVLLSGALIAPVFVQPALAATGVIYMTPASSSLQAGNSETLQLRISPGTTVDGVQATVSYSTGYLQLNSVDTSGSPFSVQLQKSAGGGTISLSLGNLSGGVSGDALIATMNFTALAGSGSTVLALSNANATSGGAYTNPAVANAGISFTSPVAASLPSGSHGSGASHASGGFGTAASTSASGTAGTDAAPSAPAATVPADPIHLSSKLGSVSYTSATLAVTSNQSLKLYAFYGTDAKNLSSQTAVIGPAAKATLEIGAGGSLTPGTTYYYQVVGEDAGGTQTKLPVRQLITRGLVVHVTVLNGQNQVLKHVKVTLHSRAQTVTTDGSGVATFTDVAPGVHHISYQDNGKAYTAAIYVENNTATASSQALAVVLPAQLSGSKVSLQLAILLIAVIVLIIYSLGFETAHSKWLQSRGKYWAMKLIATGRSWLF